jgi:hypothetical protein
MGEPCGKSGALRSHSAKLWWVLVVTCIVLTLISGWIILRYSHGEPYGVFVVSHVILYLSVVPVIGTMWGAWSIAVVWSVVSRKVRPFYLATTIWAIMVLYYLYACWSGYLRQMSYPMGIY